MATSIMEATTAMEMATSTMVDSMAMEMETSTMVATMVMETEMEIEVNRWNCWTIWYNFCAVTY